MSDAPGLPGEDTKPTVVIAEDAALLRDGVTRLLERSGFTVVAACEDATTFLAAVDEHVPDVVIVDVRMPPTFTSEGIQAALTVRDTHPDVAIMVLSQHVEEKYAGDLLSSRGKVGYLLKDRVADTRDFIASLHTIMGGGTALDHEVVAQLLARSRASDPLSGLTPRERDVLSLMAQGKTNAAISESLFVSESSTEKHVSSIFTKLGLRAEDGAHRRVLAVLTFLGQAPEGS